MEAKKAVAYLAGNVDEQPEELKGLFEKLKGYEEEISKLSSSIQEAENAVKQMAKQIDLKVGSIEGLADAITTMLPEDRISEWAEKFDNIEQGS